MDRKDRQITDADLHAYLDGHLDEERRRAVESCLAVDPELAAWVGALRKQKTALRRLFDPVLAEPVPESLRDVIERLHQRV